MKTNDFLLLNGALEGSHLNLSEKLPDRYVDAERGWQRKNMVQSVLDKQNDSIERFGFKIIRDNGLTFYFKRFDDFHVHIHNPITGRCDCGHIYQNL